MDKPNNALTEKEEKILEAALEIFAEKGFNASTTSEIAKRAGIAEGTIFRYFKTKKDILSSILVKTINLMSTKIIMSPIVKIISNSEDKDLKAVFKELVYDRLKLVDNFLPMAQVLITEALYHKEVRDAIYENIIQNALDTFKPFFQHAVEKGRIRAGLEPEAVLRSIIANIAILIAQRTLFGDKFNMEDLDAEIDKSVDILFYGISGDCK